VTSFKANDVVNLEANPNYRDAAKPAFATVTIKGGGDPTSAASAVLETGEYDYAWFLQVEPEVLEAMEAAGRGHVVRSFGTQVERIDVNMTNPDPALGNKRSTVEGGPHPSLSDPAVRKALSLAIDRDIIVEAAYGKAGRPTCNILPGPDAFASTAVDWCLKQDVEGAKKLLDDAGWVPGPDGVRAKDGVRLSYLFQTSTNSVRQAEQDLLKAMWSEIGVETELRNISPAVFFGGDASNPDTIRKFYADLEMFSNNFPGTDPESYMAAWTCGRIPGAANAWQGSNISRYCSQEYDATVAELSKSAGLEKRGELAKRLNDLLVNDGALIPLVHRGEVAAHSATLDGVKMTSWDSQLWNVGEWQRKK
jgi:peptide/nickel transport system substrate-binding protein